MYPFLYIFVFQGLSNCFTLTSGVQHDLSEFLLPPPSQSDLLTAVVTSTTTDLENETLTESATANNSQNTSADQNGLQELTLTHLDQLDSLLGNST